VEALSQAVREEQDQMVVVVRIPDLCIRLAKEIQLERTHSHGTIGCILSLRLMQLHLLLMKNSLSFRMLLTNNKQKVISQHLRPCDLTFIGSTKQDEQRRREAWLGTNVMWI